MTLTLRDILHLDPCYRSPPSSPILSSEPTHRRSSSSPSDLRRQLLEKLSPKSVEQLSPKCAPILQRHYELKSNNIRLVVNAFSPEAEKPSPDKVQIVANKAESALDAAIRTAKSTEDAIKAVDTVNAEFRDLAFTAYCRPLSEPTSPYRRLKFENLPPTHFSFRSPISSKRYDLEDVQDEVSPPATPRHKFLTERIDTPAELGDNIYKMQQWKAFFPQFQLIIDAKGPGERLQKFYNGLDRHVEQLRAELRGDFHLDIPYIRKEVEIYAQDFCEIIPNICFHLSKTVEIAHEWPIFKVNIKVKGPNEDIRAFNEGLDKALKKFHVDSTKSVEDNMAEVHHIIAAYVASIPGFEIEDDFKIKPASSKPSPWDEAHESHESTILSKACTFVTTVLHEVHMSHGMMHVLIKCPRSTASKNKVMAFFLEQLVPSLHATESITEAQNILDREFQVFHATVHLTYLPFHNFDYLPKVKSSDLTSDLWSYFKNHENHLLIKRFPYTSGVINVSLEAGNEEQEKLFKAALFLNNEIEKNRTINFSLQMTLEHLQSLQKTLIETNGIKMKAEEMGTFLEAF